MTSTKLIRLLLLSVVPSIDRHSCERGSMCRLADLGDFDNRSRRSISRRPNIGELSLFAGRLAIIALVVAAGSLAVRSATFNVTNTNDSGDGSFRQAITLANQTSGLDNITFKIDSNSLIIRLKTSLVVTDPVIIDGTTQPGFAGVPIVELTYDPNYNVSTGLEIYGGSTTVRGLVINGFGGTGILLSTLGGNLIVGNFIGTDPSGTIRRGIGYNGIQVERSSDNIIGGTGPSDRNLISGCFNAGINFYNANRNVVIGNYIGTDITGNLSIRNNTAVTVGPGDNNRIGGPLPGERNLLSGNSSGVFLAGGMGNTVSGNYIGVNAAGTAALRNEGTGVIIWGAVNSIVGGLTPQERNIISGNASGVTFTGADTYGNQLIGNFIGTDVTGSYAIYNSGNGVTFTNTRMNVVGADVPGAGNLISGNRGRGIYIYGGNTQPSEIASIQSNFIGTAADGVSPVPNGGDGIYLTNLARNVIIGANGASGGNRIAYNPGYGIRLDSFDNDIRGILIRSNTIWDNSKLGISYTINGTPATNSYCNSQTNGPNYRQNYPTITSAMRLGDSIVVSGELNSFSSTTFAVDLFACDSCDVSGFGEGKYLLGSIQVPIANSCSQTFSVRLTAPPSSARFVTATASNPNTLGTSEFSSCFRISGPPTFDFDGDGKTDVGIFRPNGATGGEWWVTKSSNGGVLSAGFGSPTDILVPADYTGDGKTDVAFFRPSTGTWYILRSEDSLFYGFPFGNATDVPVTADYDGDGKADAAVFRNGSWYILRSSDGGVTSVQFGAAGDKPVPADFDVDGKADIAIYRPNGATGGEWWVLKSSGGIYSASFGSATDKAVVGDYTGDGKADCAFFRPSNATWYILRSEDNLFFGFPFGNSTDNPAPGDYDGDGKTDAAVFRQPNEWYVNKSSGGVMSASWGADGDLPIPGSYVR